MEVNIEVDSRVTKSVELVHVHFFSTSPNFEVMSLFLTETDVIPHTRVLWTHFVTSALKCFRYLH